MKVKVRTRSLKRNPAPVVTEQGSKENYQFLENKSKTISNTDIARYHDICNVMEIPISMLSDFIASNMVLPYLRFIKCKKCILTIKVTITFFAFNNGII